MDSRLQWSTSVVLFLVAGTCTAQNLLPPGPLSSAVSGSITFTTTLRPPERPFLSVSWTFNGANVITSTTDEDLPGDGYGERITLDRTTGSLQLRRLTAADSGEYVVAVIPRGESLKQGTVVLNVYVPVSGVTVRGPTSILIEDQHSASVTCEASGSVSARVWTKGGRPVLAGPTVNLSPDNVTVFIQPVRSHDGGVYRCRVSNPISALTAAFNLTVNFGPQNVSIAGPTAAPLGRRVTLLCLVNSFPPANFAWEFNGKATGVNGSSYVVPRMDEQSEGNYTCTARNAVTRRQTSTLLYLRASCVAPCWSLSALVLSATSLMWFMSAY
ncbi:carcinoembryonic antigen-related cell adhesion molecule 16-like [Syngnathus scovelli]|uniref:carcinoembryonic antigen-related cell adhesion molecule 16-like n=1 Tax=Syngnathus scovelli TaxID=161590 RepID=UPI0035CC0BBD